MEKKIEEEKKVKNELTYEQLREFYDTSCGAWAIDRDPHEVDIDWIRENAWQLKTIDKSLLCTDCKTCPLKERQEIVCILILALHDECNFFHL